MRNGDVRRDRGKHKGKTRIAETAQSTSSKKKTPPGDKKKTPDIKKTGASGGPKGATPKSDFSMARSRYAGAGEEKTGLPETKRRSKESRRGGYYRSPRTT